MSVHRSGVVRLSREERMGQIVTAATDEFRAAGFEGASMSAIAGRAGVVEGSIYRFFNNKAHLLTHCIEVWYQAMLENYTAQLGCISGLRARLRFMIWRHLKTLSDEPEMCRLMFNQVRSGADYRLTEVYRLNSLYTERTLNIVREGIAVGELRDDLDLKLVRDAIYGAVEHRVWSFLYGDGDLDPEKVADALVDLILGGIDTKEKTSRRIATIEARIRAKLDECRPESKEENE